MPEWAVTLLFIAVAGSALLYAAWGSRSARRHREATSSDSGTTGTVYAASEGRVRDHDRDSDGPRNQSEGSDSGGDGGGGGD